MIYYTVIVRSSDATVLVESTSSGFEGNHPQVAQYLIDSLHNDKNLVPIGNRKIFVHRNQQHDYSLGGVLKGDFQGFWSGMDDLWGTSMGDNKVKSELDFQFGYFFHVLHGEGAFYICLSDDQSGQQQCVNFSYLRDIEHDFTDMYNPFKIKRANAYGMDNSFSKLITNLMHYYNTHRNQICGNKKIFDLLTEVETLKSIMGDNISIILSRGDDLEAMVRQSDEMLEESQVFSKHSTKLKNTMLYKTVYQKLILTVFGILVIYFILASFCGFGFSKCYAFNENTAE